MKISLDKPLHREYTVTMMMNGRPAMNKRQLRDALRKHHEHEQAKRGERLVISDYPYDHNPYLPHVSGPTCESVCREGIEKYKTQNPT